MGYGVSRYVKFFREVSYFFLLLCMTEECEAAALSNALSIAWTFGFSKDILGSVKSLTTQERKSLVALSSHSAVIYNYDLKSQLILQVLESYYQLILLIILINALLGA